MSVMDVEIVGDGANADSKKGDADSGEGKDEEGEGIAVASVVAFVVASDVADGNGDGDKVDDNGINVDFLFSSFLFLVLAVCSDEDTL